jgi:translation initiation factor 4G
MEPEVKALVKTENRYVVKQISEGDEKKLRDMRSILNKLCPEKFDPLVEKAMALQFDNVDLFEKSVDSVMEKALAERTFSPTNAQFCVKLQTISLSAIAEDGTGAASSLSFKKVFLNLCQREFDK